MLGVYSIKFPCILDVDRKGDHKNLLSRTFLCDVVVPTGIISFSRFIYLQPSLFQLFHGFKMYPRLSSVFCKSNQDVQFHLLTHNGSAQVVQNSTSLICRSDCVINFPSYIHTWTSGSLLPRSYC